MLDERAKSDNPDAPLFPLIQGILAFDTPYNGLARSMFVYGAFSNYQKVSSVFNVMTALSTAPASLSMALKRGATSLPGPGASSSAGKAVSNPAAWKTWQLVAVRTGTVGAIAAGGVAAYIHRQRILEGVQNMRNLKRQDLVEGYQQGVDRLGQGLAYINRGNVGQSFAWLSDHFTFVGVLMKQQELNKRLERLSKLGGIGVHDMYASMGENGYWSGGYFVPERTFCAIPAEDQPAHGLFSRHVVKNSDDEIQAHMSMFRPERNEEYKTMVMKASKLAAVWFNDDSPIIDDPKITEPEPADSPENAIKATDEGVEVEGQTPTDAATVTTEKESQTATEKEVQQEKGTQEDEDGDSMPDESPLDIAAAATLAPDAEEIAGEGEDVIEVKDKQGYVRYLMGIAHQAGTGLSQAGTGVKGYFPSKLPTIPKPGMPSMPSMSMPSVGIPSVSVPSVSMPSMSVPSVSLFSKKASTTGTVASESGATATAAETDGGEKTKETASEADTQQTDTGATQKGETPEKLISEPTKGVPDTSTAAESTNKQDDETEQKASAAAELDAK